MDNGLEQVPPSGLLTIHQAAHYFGVSDDLVYATVNDMARREFGGVYKLGCLWRIDCEVMREFFRLRAEEQASRSHLSGDSGSVSPAECPRANVGHRRVA